MDTRRLVIGFCIRLVVLYTLLAAPWPGLAARYAKGFASCCDYITYDIFRGYVIFGTDATARVYPILGQDLPHDIKLVIGNRSSRALTDRPRTSSRHLGYMPAVVLACLVLATPLPWRRRALALVWGELWIHLFIVVRLALVLAYAFQGTHPYSAFSLGPFGAKALFIAYDVAAVEPVTSYVVPLFVWIVTVFRRSDLDRFRPPPTVGSD